MADNSARRHLRRDCERTSIAHLTHHWETLQPHGWWCLDVHPAYFSVTKDWGIEGHGIQRRPNLSGAAQHYLERIGADVERPVPSRPRGAARSGLP